MLLLFQEQFLDKGLQEVLPWCMAHQFNVRTYGQAALFSMWELCKKNKLENIINKHSIIDSFMHFAKHNRLVVNNIIYIAFTNYSIYKGNYSKAF